MLMQLPLRRGVSWKSIGKAYMRISIIGNCGSGKSTLAHTISEKFAIPHIHIDRFWFEADGHLPQNKTPHGKIQVNARIEERVKEAVAQESWVSDGWYRRAQPFITERADHIVFLDISLWRRVMNHLWRVFFTARHQELSRFDDLKFTYQIIRRTFTQGPQMHEYVAQHPEKAVHLRSYKEAANYVAQLKARK